MEIEQERFALDFLGRSTKDHDDRVREVAENIKDRPKDKLLTIRKGSNSHTPHGKTYKMKSHPVYVGKLTNVLLVDKERMVAIVEGGTTMADVVDACLPLGVCPCVVPEIHDFTAAGLVNGLGIETSSHRHGGFVETVLGLEVLLADGRKVICGPTQTKEYEDLFYTLQGAYGSLGVVTAVAVSLMRAKPAVRTEYILYRSVSSYCRGMREALECGAHDFIEGFVFSREEAVIMVSRFSNDLGKAEEDGGFQHVLSKEHEFRNNEGDPWIHQHALEEAWRGYWVAGGKEGGKALWEGGEEKVCVARSDFMDTRTYFFRSERSWLWTLEAFVGAPSLTGQGWLLPVQTTTWLESVFGRSPLTTCPRYSPFRALVEQRAHHEYDNMDPVMSFAGGSSNADWTPEDLERCFVQQDTIWTLDNLEFGIEYIADNVGAWPLWQCPAVVKSDKGIFTGAIASHRGRPTFIVDCGVYGEPHAPTWRHRRTMRALQKVNDATTLFGNCYLSEHDLEDRFDMRTYRRVREKYNAVGVFRPLVDKVSIYDESKPALPKIPAWRLHRMAVFWPTILGLTAFVLTASSTLYTRKSHLDTPINITREIGLTTAASLCVSILTGYISSFILK